MPNFPLSRVFQKIIEKFVGAFWKKVANLLNLWKSKLEKNLGQKISFFIYLDKFMLFKILFHLPSLFLYLNSPTFESQ